MTHFSIVPPLGSSSTPARPGRRRLRASSALVAAAAIAPGAAFAGPDGGKVVGGDAVISQSGSVTSIKQTSKRAVIEWNNFDTAAGEAVRFAQPDKNSVAVNRITGELPTNIRGELTANGNIWVINRSGITFHDTSRVNVGGLVATTSDIDTAKFMAGSNKFEIPGKPGAQVINKGSITFGEAGLAALVGAHASNEGVIYGRLGAVAIEGRQTFAVDVSGGDGILALETSAGTAAAVSASNTGLIDAGGSYVVISAEETATALESLVTAGGAINAGAVDGRLGQVAIEGRTAVVSGAIAAAGGDVDVRGDAVTMTAGASIDVSGPDGGGTVALGGGLRGEGRRAKKVIMEAGATIAADGLGDASGGLVTLWATDFTGFAGDISAHGGDLGGDGGFVEVSAKRAVHFAGSVSALAPFGTDGTLLIDPLNLQIVSGGTDPADPTVSIDDQVNPAGLTTIDPDNIDAAVGTLILEAINDIRVINAVSTAADLSLRAGGNISVDADLITTGSLTLSADHDFSIATGISVVPGGAPSNDAGNITINAGAAVTGTTGLVLSMAATTGVLTITGESTITSGLAFALPTTTLTGTAAATFVTLAGDITQSGNFTAAGTTSASFQAAGAVDLTTGGFTNDIVSLSGSSGGNADFTLGATTAFGFDAAGFDITLEMTGGGGTDSVTTNGTTPVIANTLSLTVDGNVTLTAPTNLVGAVDGTTSGTFTMVNDGDLDLGFATTVPTAINVTTTAGSGTGALTQSTDISSALDLDVAGAATLTRAGNTFTSLTAATGAASSFATAAALGLGASSFTGATSVTTTGGTNAITQSGAISVTGGALTVSSAGATTLTEATNSFAGLVANTGAASSFVTASALDLGASTFTGATSIAATGGTNAITQSAAISVTGGALTVASAGATTLTEATNSFSGLLATTGAASSFVTDETLDLGASAFTGATAITVTGAGNDLTQSGIVSGGALAITATDAVTMELDNVFTVLTGSSGGAAEFTTTQALSLAYTAGGTLDITTGGNLTSGGEVNAAGLALDVTGTAVLGNPSNTVGSLTGTVTGALSLVDDGALSLGISADTIAINAGGAIDDGAGPVTSVGAASFFAFNDGLLPGDISDDAYFDIDFADAGTSFGGALSVSGAVIDIAATGALDVADAYATNTATFASDAALTLTRVAVGTDSSGTGASVAIDTPGDLLGIGTSVTATDIIAKDVTFGGLGSSIGSATALTGAASIDGFQAGVVTLGDATSTTISRGAASGGFAFGTTGDVTLANLDLSGGGAFAVVLGAGRALTMDGIIADALVLSAQDVRLGFIDTAGSLDVTALGSILTIADASIAVPGDVTVTAPVFAAADGPDVDAPTLTYAAPTRLLDIGGAATFDAPTAIFLVGTTAGAGFENDFQSTVAFTDSSVGGALQVAVEDANDLSIAGLGAGGSQVLNAAFAAGADAAEAGGVTQTGTLHVTGLLTVITGDDGVGGPLGDVTLTLANDLNDVAVRANDAAITATASMTVFGELDGDATLIAANSLALSGLTAVNVSMDADDVSAANSHATGTLDITVDGAATSVIDNMLVDGLTTVDAAAEFAVVDSQLTGLDLTVVGDRAALFGTTMGGPVTVDADSVMIGNVSSGDFSAVATNAIEVGALAVTGDLALESTGGSILSRDSGDLASFGPGAVTGGGSVGLERGIDTSTAIGNPSADDRVAFTPAGITRPGTVPVAAGTGLVVTGDALLIAGAVAGQGELVPGAGTFNIDLSPGGDGLTFDYRGAVTVRADGNVTLRDDAGGILFDVPSAGMPSPSGNAVFNDDGGTVTGDAALHVIGDLAVTTRGAGGDVLDAPDDTPGVALGADAELDSILVGGTSVFDLSGDLLLDGIDGNATHVLGSSVTVTAADDVVLTVDGDLSFGNVTADSLIARSTGNIDDGVGTMTIAGAAAFIAVDDNNTADLSDDSYGGVTLDNATHDFGGDVSAAGSFVTIDAAGDLALVDVWGHTGLDVSATGALDMTRIAAGGGTIGSGDTTFAIDTPAAIAAAAGGDIAVTDVIASSLTLRDLTAGDPNGNVSVTRFAVGTVDFGTPAAGLTLADGAITGALTLNAPGDLTIINIETGGATADLTASGTVTVSGLNATSLTVTAADARLGFLDIAGAMTINTTGTIEQLPDATLATLIPAGGTTIVAAPDLPLSVPSTDAGATGVIEDTTVTAPTMTRLISVGGPTQLRASTSVVLTGTPVGGGDGFENDHVQVLVQDVDGPGTPMTVILEDANDLAIAGLQGDDITIRVGTDAGATGAITQFGAIQSTGTASFIIEDDGAGNRGAATLTNGGNDFADIALSAGAADVFDNTGLNIIGADIDDALTVTSPAGPLGLQDVTAGTIAVDTFGAVTGLRVNSAGTLDIATDGALSLTDTVAGGAADLSAGGALDLDRFAMAAVQIDAGAGATVANGSAGALTTASGVTGAIALRNLTVDSVDMAADGGISAAALRTAGDMTLHATGGDVDLGRTAIGGALTIEAAAGAITTRDATDAAVFASPGSAVTVTGAQAVSIGSDASAITGASDDRVQATLTGSNDTDIASPDVTTALEVTNDAYFRAIGGDIGITTAADGALASFGGDVMLTTNGAATIEAAGDLNFAAVRATTLSGGSFTANLAVFADGPLLVRSNADGIVGADADITQTGLVQANGTATFVTGAHSGGVVPGQLGAITLSDTDNVFGAAVSALGNDVAISASGALALDDVRAIAAAGGTGALTAIAAGDINAVTLNADGDITVRSGGGAVTVDDAVAGDAFDADALGDIALIDIDAAGAITADSGTGRVGLLRVEGATLVAAAGGDAEAQDVGIAGDASLTAGGTALLTNMAAGGALDVDAAGDVTGTDVQSAGAMTVASASGAVSLTGLEAATTLGATSAAGLTLAQANVGGDAGLTAGGGMDLEAIAAGGALTAAAGGDVTAADLQSVGALSVATSGGSVQALRTVSSDAMLISSSATTEVDRAQAAGDMQLRAGSGDLRLAGIEAGGSLAAESGGGAIRTFATAAGDTVAAPSGVADGFGAVSSGMADASERALGAPTQLIDVTDAAAFRAAGDIALARAGGDDNLFAAGVAAQAGGGLLIHHDGDLTVGTGGVPAFASGAVIADGLTTTGASRTGHTRLELQGAILSTAAGAVHDIDGDYTIAAGLDGGAGDIDIDIDNLLAVDTLEVMAEGGSIAIDGSAPNMGLIALADDIDIAAGGNVAFGSVIARRLTVDGTAAGAQTIGDTALTPVRLGVDFTGTNGAAVLNDVGTGAADYALTTDAAAAMASVPSVIVTERLRLAQSGAGTMAINLNDATNMFPADVSLNVGGGVTLIEERSALPAAAESYAVSLGLGETELLQFSEFVTGGNVNVYSVDQMQFMDDVGFAAGSFVDLWLTSDASIIFRGDVGGVGGTAGMLVETLGDIYFFGTVGAGGPGNAFRPLGTVRLIGTDVVAGATPADLATFAGLIEETDLDDFVTGLGEIGVPEPATGPEFGDLGDAIYQIDDGGDKFDYFFANQLDMRSDGGALLFVINREDAGGAFEDALSFYGVNINSDVRYGSGPLGIQPDRVEMYGMVAGDRSRSAGLRVDGPIGTSYFFNACLVRQTSTCTNLGTAISVPPLPPIDVPVFELATLDLNELFGAIGNEDLWRLPPAYISDEEEDEQEGTN